VCLWPLGCQFICGHLAACQGVLPALNCAALLVPLLLVLRLRSLVLERLLM
jgi:hypothetical protein